MKRKIVFIGIIISVFVSYSILGMCSNNIITYEDKLKLVNYAYSVLDSSFDRESNSIQDIPQIGSYDKLFITLMSNKKIRACQSGKTDRSSLERTKLDVEEAVVKCISDKRFGGVLSEEEVSDTEIVFTVLFNREQIYGDLDGLEEKIELGIHAIEIENGDKKAYFKESVPITKNYSLKRTKSG